jgi:hypothetical protein
MRACFSRLYHRLWPTAKKVYQPVKKTMHVIAGLPIGYWLVNFAALHLAYITDNPDIITSEGTLGISLSCGATFLLYRAYQKFWTPSIRTHKIAERLRLSSIETALGMSTAYNLLFFIMGDSENQPQMYVPIIVTGALSGGFALFSKTYDDPAKVKDKEEAKLLRQASLRHITRHTQPCYKKAFTMLMRTLAAAGIGTITSRVIKSTTL